MIKIDIKKTMNITLDIHGSPTTTGLKSKIRTWDKYRDKTLINAGINP